VRSHECSIAGKGGHVCEGPIVFAHVRSSQTGGIGLKPEDWWGISLCDGAHRLQHQIGEPAFERLFGINLLALAVEFRKTSPDVQMKAAMQEMGNG
jgi:hypothetical protein